MGTDGGKNKNLSGLPMFHLRRIGPQPNKDRVINVMDLYRVTYMIGRSEVKVDFYIDSNNHIQSASLSRCHARVVRQNGNQHRLYDDSLNGVFVNNMKIAGSCVLREGDKVTFGHPCGARLPAGSRARQPDSHHQFMFEMCTCDQADWSKGKEDTVKETSGFKKPVSPAQASGSNLVKKTKKPTRKPTQCFTSDDIKQLKEAWDERQNSSASDTSNMEDSTSENENEPKQNTDNKIALVRNDQTLKTISQFTDEKVVAGKGKGNDININEQSTGRSENLDSNATIEITKDIEMQSESDKLIFECDECHRAAENDVSENESNKQNGLKDKISDKDLHEHIDISSKSYTSKLPEKDDISVLEGTVNSIMKDLCDLRGKIDNSVEQSAHENHIVLKSPTKDACIQTSQNENWEVGKKHMSDSPTKDMGIQTSQLFSTQADQSEVKVDSNNIELNIERSTGEINESFQDNYDSVQQNCNEEQNPESELNEPYESNKNDNTVGEYASASELPDLNGNETNSDFSLNDLKKGSDKDENNECVLIKSKHQQHLNDDSDQFIEGNKISEENPSNQSSLILSDSVEYDANEIEEPDLFFSNSIEYNGSESDRNLSDSEIEEADMDTKENCNDCEVGENSYDEKNDDEDEDTCINEDSLDEDDGTLRKCSKSKHSDNPICQTVETAENSKNKVKLNVSSGLHAENSLEKSLNNIGVDSINENHVVDGDVNDIDNSDQTVERKRKSSEDQVIETESDNLRKRHCSDTENILAKDDDKNATVESSDSSSSDNESLSSSQRGLKQLKKGVKKFFKFWSKKSYEMKCKNDISDGGYIYLQDRQGEYKLLEIESPNENVVLKSKDVKEYDDKQCQMMPKEVQCHNEIPIANAGDPKDNSSYEILEAECVKAKSDVNDINEELELSNHRSRKSSVGNEVDEDNKKLKIPEKTVEMMEGISEEAMKKDTDKDESCSIESDIESSNKDIVETSVCHTDNEIDANEMIKPSLLSKVLRTPSKQISYTVCEKSSPIFSPVFKTLSNQETVSQSQSPIITKQDVPMNYSIPVVNVKNRATKLFGNESKAEVMSELSCKFSDDDDDNGFCSPEIDFSHLDDDSDREDKDDERVEDTENDSEQDVERMAEEKLEDENCIIMEGDTDIERMTKECKKSVVCIDEDIEEALKSDFYMDQNEKDEGTIEDLNIEEEDPLENLINSVTEDEEDNDAGTGSEKSKKPYGMKEIEFDFCDSETDGENMEIPTDGKRVDFIESESDENDSNDTDGDYNGKDMSVSKKSLKRKCESDSEDRTSKQQKSPIANETMVDQSSPQKRKNSSLAPFKTPVSLLKDKHARTSVSSPNSPGHRFSTQLMESPGTQDLDALSLTQVTNVTEQLEKKVSDSSRSKASRNKAKDLLEKLKAKRRIKEELADEAMSSSPTPDTSQSSEVELYSRMGNRERSQAQVVLENVDKHVNSCRDVIMKMRNMFESCGSLNGNPRVTAWRKELQDIEKRLELPKTVIAVVGDTGAGKSSLMNAILDHRSVLPTSGIRACTAVVVEVMNNTSSSYFEADIEFLQRQEWIEELQVLLKDLTGLDGTVKNRPPDPTSDAFVSYCKVKAVYGRIDRFEVLARLTTVTHWLGRVKVIKSSKPSDFRRQVEKYIETQEPGAGGQYWPIVKHVRLRMPNCDVCSSGASLVDLPGVRDSNAARDKIAKEYLKNCTAVWVVSSIHRAIDDKTAKDLLGENFRRQLLMDGQYGSIAFICTKTDVLMPSEIIRPLELEEQTKKHEDKISKMEAEKSELELNISNATRETRNLKKTIAGLKNEAKELSDNLTELSNLIDSSDLDNSQSEEKEAIEEYEKELQEKVDELNEAENRMDELHDQKLEATQKTLELEKILNEHRKAIAAICARARNEYSKAQIKRDFKAGLKEMKRRAGILNVDNDEEEDIYSDDDDDDDDDDNDVGSHAENLKVFCCSSTEYQKMKNLLTDDGPPQVFSTLEDTQIPALRQHVHEMTSVRHRQWLERLIRYVGRFVFDLQMYMSEGGDMKSRDRVFAKTAIDSELQKFDLSLAPVFQNLTSDIDGVFDGSIRQKVEEGATNAATEANDTCAKWGAPVNRDKTKDKKSGGLHWATYRATVRRQGVFTSHSWGPVDFNEDLAEPMYRSMTIVWDRAFSGMLWRIFDRLKQEIILKLKTFIVDLTPRLEELGIQASKTVRVTTLLLSSASNKLTEMVAHLKDMITNKQREISRIITPIVQTNLLPEYTTSAAECGPGMYMRVKACMSNGIDKKRFTMFDDATQQLMKYLIELQNEIVQYVHQVCQTLIQDLRTAFEPLWEAPANMSVIRSAFRQAIGEVCTRMHDIYDEAGLSHTEERELMSAKNTGTVQAGCMATTTNCDSGTRNDCFKSGLQVKAEKLSQGYDSETMENALAEQIMHIKQEKATDEIDSKIPAVESLVNFSCQTLQDLHCGKLEMSPVEVTVKTTPMSSSGPNVMILPSSQLNTTTFNRPGSILVPTSGIKTNIAQPKEVLMSLQKESTAQYGEMQSLYNRINKVQHYQINTLPNGQKVLLPSGKGPVSSTYVPSASKSTVLLNSNPFTSASIVNKLPNSNYLHNVTTKPNVNNLKQAQTIQVKKSVVGVQHGKSILNSYPVQPTIPTLNMVFGKENVSLSPMSGSSSQSCGINSSQSKGKKKSRIVSLSRSQKNSPAQMPSPVPVIKTEPVDKGVYGRVKNLGTIDLTDD